ncbi:gigaxonin [Mastacembelus armatus]|uniref:Gigaxonin n=1 Tax=Mastacembelus armatus TaxID=205130 RepID=A0A3Q3S650_9TELE|nr:gigaxonin [Mastacembelus armatus]XP_026166361.1 gigaxonin [Mastacembelus armatus]XP_026166362.1 gigaxonin [Mastacembelus armatus]
MPDPGSSETGSKVSDPQHSQKLLRVLRTFWQEHSFHDALLVVDGEELPVQKNILAASSPYIRTKLNYNPPKEDGSTYRIELQGVSMAIMKQILDYVFSGEITLSEDTIQDMVQASDLLLMTDLKSLCCQFLERCITAENCIGIRLFSLHYCLYHVHYAATEFLQTHFRDVALTEEFRELPPDRLCEVLAMEKLNVGNEKHILEAVVRWFSHDPEIRRVHMKEVMSVVWLQGLEQSYLREQAMGEPLMREVIREYCQPVLGDGQLQGEALLAAFKPRGYSECIVIAGGEDRKNRKPTAVTRCMCPLYDNNRRAWIELQPMSIARLSHGVVAAEGFLFVLGGTDEHNTVLDSGEKYDPDSNAWSPIPAMLQARQNFGVVELDGLIYVLGGENGVMELTSVEVFDPHFSTWKMQTSMTMVRKIGCYAVMNKKIYAMGGGSYGKLFDSVECFDPKTQQWTGLCPLKERRFGSVACGVGQELYVFGGVRSQENENPEQRHMMTCKSEFYHDEMRRWMCLDDQNLCIQTSSSFVYGAVPIGASIYVVGDLDTGTSFDYIREFRRSTGTWHRTKPMLPTDLSKTACAALRIANCRLFRLQLSQGMFRIRL